MIPSRRPRLAPSIALTAIALLVSVPAASADEPRLAFVETSAIVVTVSAPADASPSASPAVQPTPAVAHLVNLAPVAAKITVVVANIKDAAGESVSRIPGLPNVLRANVTAEPGQTIEITILPTPAASASAAFSAELVATSTQGGLSRLPLEVKFLGAPAATPSPGPLADLRKPISDQVELTATKLIPTFLSEIFGIAEPLGDKPKLSVAPDLASASIGSLRSSSGAKAEVVLVTPAPDSGGLPELQVTRYTSADVYSGKFEAGTGDGATRATIKLSVRDHIVWAAAALLLGLFAASSLETFLGQDRPRRRLRLFLAEQQERALAVQDHERDKRSALHPAIAPAAIIRIYERPRVGGSKGLLSTAAGLALNDFDAAWDRAARDTKWSPNGEGSKAYAGYVDVLDTTVTRLDEIDDTVRRIARSVAGDALPDVPAVAGAKKAIAGAFIDTPDALSAKAKAVTDAASIVGLLANAFDHLAAVLKRLGDAHLPTAALDGFAARLADANVTDVATVASIVMAIDAAYDGVVRPKVAAGEFDESLAAAGMRLNLQAAAVEPPLRVEPFESSKVIARKLGEWERRFAWLAGALVLGTGLSVLYFTDPAWGSNADYLAAIVWGTTVGAGLQLAKGIGNRLPAAG